MKSDWEITNNLRGWKSIQIERGIGKVYNSRWGEKIVLELDGNQNNCVSQSINLERRYYKFQMQYAARSGYVETSSMSIKWNGQ